MSTPGPTTATPIVACVKWVDLRPGIDPVHGTVTPSARGGGFSPADEAALEVALRLAEVWGMSAALVCAGPPEAEAGLAALAAAGTLRVVRVDQSADLPSELVAEVLAPVLGPADLAAEVVVCGDLSYDRGSGSVPALLAHQLGHAQALGLIEVAAGEGPRRIEAVRRLDGGRRERIDVAAPAVLSVEGAVAVLRRAGLAASLGAAAPVVEVRPGRIENHVEPPRLRPWRPRARVLPPPAGDSAFARIVHLTDALVDRSPPRTVEAEPADAARIIVEQLRDWGYLESGA